MARRLKVRNRSNPLKPIQNRNQNRKEGESRSISMQRRDPPRCAHKLTKPNLFRSLRSDLEQGAQIDATVLCGILGIIRSRVAGIQCRRRVVWREQYQRR